MIYVNDLNCMSRLLNEPDVFVGRANPFICDELNLNGIPAAGFAEELYRMFDSSMGNISYRLNRVFLNTEGMHISERRPDFGAKKTSLFDECSLQGYFFWHVVLSTFQFQC